MKLTMLQLILCSGEIKEVPVVTEISIQQYFKSITSLNKTAHIYGVVYLATEEALNQLETYNG